MRIAPLLLVLTCLTRFAAAQDAATPPAKTGTFTTTFSESSPLTTPAERARRFPRTDIPAYDLSQEPFLIHVPDNYDPATPCGILLLLNYKDNNDVPPLWPPVLAAHHLIYVMDTHHDHPTSVIALLSVDAVHNLSKLYHIDPARIYVIGFSGSQTTALTYPDVFTAALFWNRIEYFRPIQNPKTRGQFPATLPRPPAASLTLARTHPYILAASPDVDAGTAAYHALVLRAFQQDGFKTIESAVVSLDDFHYPNLTTPWLESALAFFEAHPATTRPSTLAADEAADPLAATQPSRPPSRRIVSTRPILSEPQRLLALAKVFINNKAYPPASQRLETIIKNYPDDPAAKEAQALLDSINQKPTSSIEWRTSTLGPQP